MWIPKVVRTKKPPKIRRHKQKVKTKNPDFVQNGFVKVGTVCEIFVKKSINKKKGILSFRIPFS